MCAWIGERRRERRRFRRRLASLLLAASLLTFVALLALDPGRKAAHRVASPAVSEPQRTARPGRAPDHPTVGVRVLKLFDSSRDRDLTTIVLYPGAASRSARSVNDALPRGGPYPLIVFGHGFAVTPAPYRPLLDRWVQAGFVVAAPLFPKSNANAPGGPDERDLPNQPADMNFVVRTMLIRSSAHAGPLAGLISSHVALAGQSDGADTALAAAFDPTEHVLPIQAAVILSGAEDPFTASFTPQPGTPLLAIQGTADTVNLPSETLSYFDSASPPKYLLQLDGAEHQAPYTVPGPQLDAVARTSVAFLDRYLKRQSEPLRRIVQRGDAGPSTALRAYP